MRQLIILAIVVIGISSCRTFYPNVMFKTPKKYEFVDFDSVPPQEYKINPGDQLQLQVQTNDAFNNVRTIVSAFEGGTGNNGFQRNAISYLVRQDSIVLLPIVGEHDLVGMTIPEAEAYLRDKYGVYFQDPFIILKVSNRRVIVYSGNSSSGKVVTLSNEHMSLIEVLAQSGGIQSTGKAWRVKVIRGDLKNPQIALLDLETVEGMRKAEMTVQANDIIYIDPRMSISRGLLSEITPILALITSVTTLYLLILSLSSGN
jgi:polysaccharide biosynthesis/export protein